MHALAHDFVCDRAEMANAGVAVPFANDGSFLQQFMAQQVSYGVQAAPSQPQDVLMQGVSAVAHFDVHNSSPQLIFSSNSTVAKRHTPLDPTASSFCFAALVPVTERHGCFAVRLESGASLGQGDTAFRTKEGMFLGVGIARKDRFGAEGFGRGDDSWGLSNRRHDDCPAVFTTSGGIAEKRLPTLQRGDVVSLHWDLDAGTILMRINNNAQEQHVFRVPAGAPESYVAGVSLADEHQVRLVDPPEGSLMVSACARAELAELSERDARRRDSDRDRYRGRYRGGRSRSPEPTLRTRNAEEAAAPDGAGKGGLGVMAQMQQQMQLQQRMQLQQLQEKQHQENLQRVAAGLPPLALPVALPTASPWSQQAQSILTPAVSAGLLAAQPAHPASLTENLKNDPAQLPWNKGQALASKPKPPPPPPVQQAPSSSSAAAAAAAAAETEVKADMMLIGLEKRQLLRKQVAEEKKKNEQQQRALWELRRPYFDLVVAQSRRFVCPIGAAGEPMMQPVVAADGHTYEKSNIEGWIQYYQDQKWPVTSPVTEEVLKNTTLVPNHMAKALIDEAFEVVEKGHAPHNHAPVTGDPSAVHPSAQGDGLTPSTNASDVAYDPASHSHGLGARGEGAALVHGQAAKDEVAPCLPAQRDKDRSTCIRAYIHLSIQYVRVCVRVCMYVHICILYI